MYRVTEVVKHLLIINILMYLGTMLLGEPSDTMFRALASEENTNVWDWGRLSLAMFYPTSPFFQPFQIITHMFMHANPTHLLFNMFALFMFGPPLEMRFGSKRFLIYYLLTGFGALLLHMFAMYLELTYLGSPGWVRNIPMLGASGAVFGLLAGFGLCFPNNILQLIIPPIALKAKYFVLIYAAIELFLGLNPLGLNTGIAHFAHLGGALAGLLIYLYWRQSGNLV